jgi:hypothetical protein
MAFSLIQSNKVKITAALFALMSLALHLLILKTPSLDFFTSEKNKTIKTQSTPQSIQVSLQTKSSAPKAEISRLNQTVSATQQARTNAQKKEKNPSTLSEKITPIPIQEIVAELPAIEVENTTNTTEVNNAGLKSEFSLYYPDSAELMYEVERIDKSNSRITGNAKLSWKIQASYYAIKMEVQASMLLTNINLYTMKSEGDLDYLGLRPRLASEKRLNRAETATHFDSKAATILFSSSNQKVEMQGVAQDRSSLLFQLASAVKSDATQFTPGRIFNIQVGEDRAAINYVFEVVGTEKISTKLGTFDALHFVRKPLIGSYQSQLDLWFAPELGGYPIQIRNTEGNGNITTQTLSQLQTFPSQES